MEEVYHIDDQISLKVLRFFMSIIGLWPTASPKNQLISKIAWNITVATIGSALFVEATDFYYCLGDLNAASQRFTDLLTVLIEFIKAIKFAICRRKVVEFNAYTEKIFWKSRYTKIEWKIMNDCNEKSKKIVIVHAFLSQGALWLSFGFPLAEGDIRNSSTRQLPVNVYVNYPYKETPFYQITILGQACAAMGVGIAVATFCIFLGTTNFYTAGQFRILQQRLENVIYDVNNRRFRSGFRADSNESTFVSLRNCIKSHQMLIRYVEKIESIFSFIILVQALGSVLLLCFCGFQLLLGVETSVFQTALSVQYLLAAVVQLFIFSWSCHEIILESTAIAEAAYRSSWFYLPNTTEGRACRQCLIVMIYQAQRPCLLTVGKFTPMSLQTFTSIIKSAMSYFTVLRQMKEAEE